MHEQSIEDIIDNLKGITLSCIHDADSDDFDELQLHIKERGNIIDKLESGGKYSGNIRELLEANDIYSLDLKLKSIVTKKKLDIHEKMTNLTINKNASKKYKTTQLMTNVFFNTKR